MVFVRHRRRPSSVNTSQPALTHLYALITIGTSNMAEHLSLSVSVCVSRVLFIVIVIIIKLLLLLLSSI